MTGRPRGGRRLTVLATAALAVTGTAGAPAAAVADDRPNVVVMLTDDQTVEDLYARVGRTRVMPKTLRLIGGKGVTFSRYYASNPISCPSRVTNLTGQYAKNHRVIRNFFPKAPGYCSAPKRLNYRNLLPVWLQQSGYRTLHFGRFLNAFGLGRPKRRPPGWDWWANPVETNVSAGALFFGYRLNVNGTLTKPFGSRRKRRNDLYFTNVMTRMANEQIAVTPRDQPFYLQLDHRAPHEDLAAPVGPQPAPRHARTLRGRPPAKRPNFNEADVSDKALWLRRSTRFGGSSAKEIAKRKIRRLRSLRAVDDSVAAIVRALRKHGELSSTYVFFASDNGFFNGEHRIGKGKFRPFEESARVPLLMRGPGIPKSRVSRELAMNVDLAPTIVHVARITTGRRMDGRSLLPFARKPRRRTGRPVLLESWPLPKLKGSAAAAARSETAEYRRSPAGPFGMGPMATAAREPTPKPWRAIVRGRWKLVRYRQHGLELYDLKRDPFELRSRAYDPRYRRTVSFLKRALRRLERCKGASCRRAIKAPPGPK